MSNNLFTFGCSYATGEELLLHELPIDDFRLKTARDPRKYFKLLEESNLESKYNQLKLKQKQLAWPKLLADKLNYNCINFAESGNSLDKILFQVLSHADEFTSNDLVIVSLTKANRNAVFNKTVESFQLPSLMWPVKTLIGVKDTGDTKPVIDKRTDKALLNWFTDDRVAWDFVKNLQILTTLNVHIVPSMKNNIDISISTIEKLYETIQKSYLTQNSLDDFCDNWLAWGHPDHKAHVKYAEHLYELLR